MPVKAFSMDTGFIQTLGLRSKCDSPQVALSDLILNLRPLWLEKSCNHLPAVRQYSHLNTAKLRQSPEDEKWLEI